MSLDPLVFVLAVSRNGVIGKDGKVPWRLPEDLKHFKAMTMGHAILMGRKTYEETRRPLPGRRNIIISRTKDLSAPGCEVTTSLHEAIAMARAGNDSHPADPEPRVIGGAEIYRLALPLATRIYLTEVDRIVEGDTVFHLDRTGFKETERRQAASPDTPDVWFVTLERE